MNQKRKREWQAQANPLNPEDVSVEDSMRNYATAHPNVTSNVTGYQNSRAIQAAANARRQAIYAPEQNENFSSFEDHPPSAGPLPFTMRQSDVNIPSIRQRMMTDYLLAKQQQQAQAIQSDLEPSMALQRQTIPGSEDGDFHTSYSSTELALRRAQHNRQRAISQISQFTLPSGFGMDNIQHSSRNELGASLDARRLRAAKLATARKAVTNAMRSYIEASEDVELQRASSQAFPPQQKNPFTQSDTIDAAQACLLLGDDGYDDYVMKSLKHPTLDEFYKAEAVERLRGVRGMMSGQANLGAQGMSMTNAARIRWAHEKDQAHALSMNDSSSAAMHLHGYMPSHPGRGARDPVQDLQNPAFQPVPSKGFVGTMNHPEFIPGMDQLSSSSKKLSAKGYSLSSEDDKYPTTSFNQSNVPSPPMAVVVLEMPRRPLSAYNFFFSEERERILKIVASADCEASEKEDRQLNEDEIQEALKQAAEKNPPEKLLHPESSPSEVARRMLLQQQIPNNKMKKRRPHRKSHGKIGFKSLAKIIAQRWRDLPSSSVAHYKYLAGIDLKRYKEEMSEYNKKKKYHEKQQQMSAPGSS